MVHGCACSVIPLVVSWSWTGFGPRENDLDASSQERIDWVYTWQVNKANGRKNKKIIHRGCRRRWERREGSKAVDEE